MDGFPKKSIVVQPEQGVKDPDEISAIKNVDWSISDEALEEFASFSDTYTASC